MQVVQHARASGVISEMGALSLLVVINAHKHEMAKAKKKRVGIIKVRDFGNIISIKEVIYEMK